ncbi:MAG: tetratricopeptide repeat protein [Chloroflexi bacterium]|nr:tetratricopeptide repeat protein [Chloroflexota bacterium]
MIETFCELPFVKVIDEKKDTGEKEFALHDAMYDMLYEHIRGGVGAPRLYEKAIKYLDEKLKEVKQKLNDKTGQHLNNLQAQPAQPGDTLIERFQEQRAYEIDRLFYRMALDPLNAYQDYRAMFMTAITNRDTDFDAQLQDELGRFFEKGRTWGDAYRQRLLEMNFSWQKIACEEAIRWVERRLRAFMRDAELNRYEDALQKVEHINQDKDFTEVLKESPILRHMLEIARLSAETHLLPYVDQADQIEPTFLTTIDSVENLKQASEQSGATTDPMLDQDYIDLVLINAYNYRGYYFGTQERYGSAIDDYRKALELMPESSEMEGLRIELLLSLCIALHQHGDSTSEDIATQALLRALNQGSQHQVATAFSALARMKRFTNPEDALRWARQAGKILEDLESARTLALCIFTEGMVRTELALRADPDQADEELGEALKCYEKAYERFANPPGELLRRVEVRLKCAIAYRKYCGMLIEKGKDASQYLENALQELQKAADLWKPGIAQSIRAKIEEQAAVIYIHQRNFAQAREKVQLARRYVQVGDTLHNGWVYHLRNAQITLQEALCDFGEGKPLEGCLNLQRAFDRLPQDPLEQRSRAVFRRLGEQALLAIGDLKRVEELETETERTAERAQIGEDARAEMERLFQAVKQKLAAQ